MGWSLADPFIALVGISRHEAGEDEGNDGHAGAQQKNS